MSILKKNKAYITHVTKNYDHIAINLAKSLNLYSNYPLIVYTIGYEGSAELKKYAICKTIQLDFKIPEINNNDFVGDKIMYVNRFTYRTYVVLSSKVDVMIQANLDGIDEWCYLDSDCLANSNIDEIFEYSHLIENYPIATLGPQEYVMFFKNNNLFGNPFWKGDDSIDLTATLEWPLMDLFGMESNQRLTNYKTTNILLGNYNCNDFLKEFKRLKDILPTICNINKYLPYHEETLYNVMVWNQNNPNLHMPMVYINITSADTVKHFLNNTTTHDKFITNFYKLPADKSKIKVFHGEKRSNEVDKIFNLINFKKRIVFLAPHLSTGGMPEFLLKRIEALNDSDEFEVNVIEYCLYADTYVVQRNKIKSLLGDRFYEIAHLGSATQEEREAKLIELLESINPHIIHIEESPESFDSFNQLSFETQSLIYSTDRPWKIAETCHNIWFQPVENKRIFPDAFALVSPEHANKTFVDTPSIKEEIYFPIIEQSVSQLQRRKFKTDLGFDPETPQYHLVNIGLWTPGKNQGEAIQWARALEAQDPGRFQFHFVGNQASNFEHYWGPLMENLPANCHVWGERSDVDTFYQIADAVVFNSTWECNPLTIRQSLGYPIPVIARNLPQYWEIYKDLIIEITDSLEENIGRLLLALEGNKPTAINQGIDLFKQQHIDLYNKMLKEPVNRKLNKNKKDWVLEWINGPKVTSKSDRPIQVDFRLAGKSVYTNQLTGPGHWCTPSIEYWADWQVVIDGEEYSLDPTAPTIIQFDSSSLGDSISWVEPCVEFKKQRGIKKLFIATHKNWLFDQAYYRAMGIEFIKPGEWPEDAIAKWHVGVYMEDIPGEVWFPNRNRRDWRKIYLGDIATDALGIDQVMRAPKLAYTGKWTQEKPYICIATASTAQAKYWNNPTGWQLLVDYYNGKGYDVYHISKETHDLTGVINPDDNLETTYKLLQGAELFYGISSGLSWFAWATDVPIVLISGFTPEICEFNDDKTLRIINKSVCNSCWLDEHFDRGDWNWCPRHKGTERMFECTKTITAIDVIEQVEEWQKSI